MKLQVHQIRFHRVDMRTRFPFRYGIASLTELPHLFVVAEVSVDGHHCTGIAADGLPPKWFTKNAETTFDEDDLPNMQRVIRQAADIAVGLQTQPSVFQWWRELYTAQHSWAADAGIPSLLAGFGISLIERAVIDAACRQQQITFFDAIRSNAFQIDLESIRPALQGFQASDVLPPKPRSSVFLRHTVGLSDPLTDEQISPDERTDDGLPHSLVECIRRYGLKYFKMKLSGNMDHDIDRLSQIANLLRCEVGPAMRLTLDGNEQYNDIVSFRESWETLRSVPEIRQMIDESLLFVEQPLHRDHALDPTVGDALRDWTDAPRIIIDESDANLDSFPLALDLGYSGTSHKNCKGIFKSIAAAATIRQQSTKERPLFQSAEDLVNIGPVALSQDLAVVAALGIEHVERNGHHYLAGLSMFPQALQEQVATDLEGLYQWTDHDFVALSPVEGKLDLTSINRAPFGLARLPDLTPFPLWDF